MSGRLPKAIEDVRGAIWVTWFKATTKQEVVFPFPGDVREVIPAGAEGWVNHRDGWVTFVADSEEVSPRVAQMPAAYLDVSETEYHQATYVLPETYWAAHA